MKENFEHALENILKFEGGYSNHPLDKGGPTNEGITLATLQDYYEDYDYGDFDDDGAITVNDIKALDTPEEAAPIYKTYYWDKMMLDLMPGGVDFLMFDFGVNSGPKNATRILQRAINRTNISNPITVDGILGNHTFDCMMSIPVRILVSDMIAERDAFYNKFNESDLPEMLPLYLSNKIWEMPVIKYQYKSEMIVGFVDICFEVGFYELVYSYNSNKFLYHNQIADKIISATGCNVINVPHAGWDMESITQQFINTVPGGGRFYIFIFGTNNFTLLNDTSLHSIRKYGYKQILSETISRISTYLPFGEFLVVTGHCGSNRIIVDTDILT